MAIDKSLPNKKVEIPGQQEQIEDLKSQLPKKRVRKTKS